MMVGTAVTITFGLATGFDRAADRADLPDVIARFDATDRERRRGARRVAPQPAGQLLQRSSATTSGSSSSAPTTTSTARSWPRSPTAPGAATPCSTAPTSPAGRARSWSRRASPMTGACRSATTIYVDTIGPLRVQGIVARARRRRLPARLPGAPLGLAVAGQLALHRRERRHRQRRADLGSGSRAARPAAGPGPGRLLRAREPAVRHRRRDPLARRAGRGDRDRPADRVLPRRRRRGRGRPRSDRQSRRPATPPHDRRDARRGPLPRCGDRALRARCRHRRGPRSGGRPRDRCARGLGAELAPARHPQRAATGPGAAPAARRVACWRSSPSSSPRPSGRRGAPPGASPRRRCGAPTCRRGHGGAGCRADRSASACDWRRPGAAGR